MKYLLVLFLFSPLAFSSLFSDPDFDFGDFDQIESCFKETRVSEASSFKQSSEGAYKFLRGALPGEKCREVDLKFGPAKDGKPAYVFFDTNEEECYPLFFQKKYLLFTCNKRQTRCCYYKNKRMQAVTFHGKSFEVWDFDDKKFLGTTEYKN